MSCSPFAPLEEHAGRFCRNRRPPSLSEASAVEALRAAAAGGLLVSATDVLGGDAGVAGADAPPIRSIGVITHRRPEALVRCLSSFADDLRASGRSALLTVVDSTPHGEADGVRAAVRSLEQRRQLPVRYLGLVEKRALGERLSRAAGVDPKLAELALLGLEGHQTDVGANRNAMLLLHAGRTVFCADDDMVCDLRGPVAPVDTVALTGEEGAVPVTLHRTFEAAREALPPRPSGVLDLHERQLGRTVAEALAGSPRERIALGSFPPRLLGGLLSGNSRVVASFGGYYGDAGASYPSFFLWSGATVRQQLAGGVEDHRALIRSRQITRVSPQLTLTGGRFSMCGHVALDCRTLLPPFFSNLRGEDHLFGQVVRGCFDDVLFAHVPQAIAHRPWERRARGGPGCHGGGRADASVARALRKPARGLARALRGGRTSVRRRRVMTRRHRAAQRWKADVPASAAQSKAAMTSACDAGVPAGGTLFIPGVLAERALGCAIACAPPGRAGRRAGGGERAGAGAGLDGPAFQPSDGARGRPCGASRHWQARPDKGARPRAPPALAPLRQTGPPAGGRGRAEPGGPMGVR